MHVRAALLALALLMTGTAQAAERPRAREAGITFGILQPGPLNAITDVAGVKVGHVTLVEGANIRTGVTAILPHEGNLYQDKVPAGFAVGNAFGKFMGSTQIRELGELETPILLTNTLNVPEAAAGIIEWTLRQPATRRCARSTPWSAKPTMVSSTTSARGGCAGLGRLCARFLHQRAGSPDAGAPLAAEPGRRASQRPDVPALPGSRRSDGRSGDKLAVRRGRHDRRQRPRRGAAGGRGR